MSAADDIVLGRARIGVCAGADLDCEHDCLQLAPADKLPFIVLTDLAAGRSLRWALLLCADLFAGVLCLATTCKACSFFALIQVALARLLVQVVGD